MNAVAVRRATARIFVALVAAHLAAGCPADPREKAKPKVVARITTDAGERQVSEMDLIAELAQRGTARVAEQQARETIARLTLDELIDRELILAAATKADIKARDEDVEREVRARADGYPPGQFQRLLTAEQLTIDAFKAKVRARLVEDAYLRAKLAEVPALTDEELRARYTATVANVQLPEQVHVRQILLRTSEEATHVLNEIRTRKISFEAAAQKYSVAPDADQSGDLGWFSSGEMPDAFDVCFNLEKNTVSDVVASNYGFHIFQILDHRAPRTESFEAVRERLEDDLVRERQTAALDALRLELRKASPVVVDNAAFQAVLATLPPPPVTPIQGGDDEPTTRALDSHGNGIDPVPPVPGKEKEIGRRGVPGEVE